MPGLQLKVGEMVYEILSGLVNVFRLLGCSFLELESGYVCQFANCLDGPLVYRVHWHSISVITRIVRMKNNDESQSGVRTG